MYKKKDYFLTLNLAFKILQGLCEISVKIYFISSQPRKAVIWYLGFPGGSDDKESACKAGDRFNSKVAEIPWRRTW